jgi:SOS-response transcriptional repressor LexA
MKATHNGQWSHGGPPVILPPTPRQQQVLDAIRAATIRTGHAPTLQEMAHKTESTSTTAIAGIGGAV